MVNLEVLGKSVDSDKKEVNEVLQVPLDLDSMWNKRDAQGFASLFNDTADFRLQNGVWVKGKKEVEGFWGKNVFPAMSLTAKHTTNPWRIRFVSDNIVVGDGRLIINDTNEGEEKILLDGEGTMILKKTEHKWLIEGIRLSVLTK